MNLLAAAKRLEVFKGGRKREVPLAPDVLYCKTRLLEMLEENPHNLPDEHLDGIQKLIEEHAPKAKNVKHLISLVQSVAREKEVNRAHDEMNSVYLTFRENMKAEKKRELTGEEEDGLYRKTMRSLEPEVKEMALRGLYANLLLKHFEDYNEEVMMFKRSKAA